MIITVGFFKINIEENYFLFKLFYINNRYILKIYRHGKILEVRSLCFTLFSNKKQLIKKIIKNKKSNI